MEVERLGNIYGFNGGNYAGNVYNKEALAPTILNMQGGGRQPMIVENVIIGGMQENQAIKKDGVCTTLTSSMGTGGGYIPMILENQPISTKGKPLEIASTILNGYHRTNMTGFNADNGVVETYSPYVNQKYTEFYEEHNYIPEYFNPYNKTELTDIAPTLTAQGESVTKSSTVLKCDTQYRIRKLTPLECWRLMDFTDEDFEKAAQVNSNTQLYKQAGNSIIRNVLVAILGQLIEGKEDAYRKV